MTQNDQRPETPVRRPYRTPELRDLGTLSEVTAAGGPNPSGADLGTYTS